MIRATFLSPGFLVGGVEQWFLSLARFSDPEKIRWSLAVSAAQRLDPVAWGQLRGVDTATGPRACAEMAEASDVIVAWAHERPRDYTGRFDGPFVQVAHGACQWTSNWINAAGHDGYHFAAVSDLAARTCPPGARVIRLGIDLDRCQPKVDRHATRAAWGIDPGEIVLGYVGRLSPEKGCHHVAALGQYLGPPYRVVFVGPTQYAQRYVGLLEATDPRAVFAGASESIGDALAAMDVVLCLSPQEGGPLAALEAMAARVPLVATRTGLLTDLDGCFVLIDQPRNVALLATATKIALRGVQEAGQPTMIDRAAAVVAREYTAERMAAEWTDYLSELLAGPRLPPPKPRPIYCQWVDPAASPLVCGQCRKSFARPAVMPWRRVCETTSRSRTVRTQWPAGYVGPGTLLRGMLAAWGVHARGCDCGVKAAEMDLRGPAWCRENSREVGEWLLRQGERRNWGLPAKLARFVPLWAVRLGVRPAVALLIRRAIRQSEATLAQTPKNS